MTACRRFWVSGRVQGVWFRESTRRQAARLGLAGYAVNLPDGRVEVLACGAAESLDTLEEWLGHGPPAAEVSSVRAEPAGDEPPEGFRTG